MCLIPPVLDRGPHMINPSPTQIHLTLHNMQTYTICAVWPFNVHRKIYSRSSHGESQRSLAGLTAGNQSAVIRGSVGVGCEQYSNRDGKDGELWDVKRWKMSYSHGNAGIRLWTGEAFWTRVKTGRGGKIVPTLQTWEVKHPNVLIQKWKGNLQRTSKWN